MKEDVEYLLTYFFNNSKGRKVKFAVTFKTNPLPRVFNNVDVGVISAPQLLEQVIQRFYPDNAPQMKALGEFALTFHDPEFNVQVALEDMSQLPEDKNSFVLELVYRPTNISSSVVPVTFSNGEVVF